MKPPPPPPRPFCVCIVNLSVWKQQHSFLCVQLLPPQVSFCKGVKKQFNVANYKMKSTINNSYLFLPFCLFTKVGRKRLVSCVTRSPLWSSTLTSKWTSWHCQLVTLFLKNFYYSLLEHPCITRVQRLLTINNKHCNDRDNSTSINNKNSS
jgi:hypothetical protein